MSAAEATAPAHLPRWSWKRLARSRRQELAIGLVPYVLLIVMVAWVGVVTPASLSGAQFSLTLNQTLVLILVGMGQTFVLLSGGIDLSVAGVMSLTNAICAVTLTSETRIAWLVPAILLLGWVPGLINGVLIVAFKLQPFIVTLGTWFVFAGVALYVLPVAGGDIDPSLADLTRGSGFGVDRSVVIVVAIALLGMWLLRTRTGFEIRAFGSDPGAAHLGGIRTARTIITTYAISSMFAVAAGVFLSSQSLAGDPTVGNKYLLSSVAAAVIGGTSLFGGSATVVGTIVGALVLGYVSRVTFAMDLPAEWGLIFAGMLLAASVALQGLVRTIVGRRGK